ncbi:hypothetical protein [Streptomyces palmae]|uniref:Septum formation-related domain-containing protein n=1 Tax=Streptomyces palmae TaxID=1701085 RepID=A0A4Z0HA05_9ACTN|nr:hypothetical protein [Streptomyces palmae]TGB14774.1 hypothetical protein E4099_07900 [Streptomyces palmae]
MTFPPPSNQPGPPAGSGGFGPPPDTTGSAQPQGFGPPVPPGGFGAPGAFGPVVPPPPPRRGRGRVAAIAAGSVVAVALVVGAVVVATGGDDHPASAKRRPSQGGGTSTSASASPSAEPSTSEDPGQGAPLGGGPGQSDDEEPGPSDSASQSASPPSDLVPYVQLKPGQCFDHPALDSSVTTIETRSCDRPHDGEVIANETLTGEFATEAAIQRKAMSLCRADAAKRLQSIPRDRMYYYYALYPARDTYTYQGKNKISCSLTLSSSLNGPKLDKPLPG